VAVFGGYDESQMSGPLHYIDLFDDFWWEIPLSSATYKGHSFVVEGKTAIIDTGSSYVFIP